MRKNSTYANMLIRIALILSAATFLGACRKDKHAPKGASPVISPNGSGPQGTGAPRADGTSDPGGGTGVRGRVFESYIVDPQTLRGYAQYVKPFLDQMKSEGDKQPKGSNDKGDDASTPADFFKLKKWYLLPMNLNCVDKDVIGLSFARDGVDVLACQTQHEVWIDENKTKSSNDREFAKLITHEFVIGLYTMRFQKMSEIIAAVAKATGQNFNMEGITIEQLDQIMPPETQRKLNGRDYEIIRAATDWLFEKGATATFEQFERNFEVAVFDQRFRTRQQNNQRKGIEASVADILNVLNASHSAGIIISECRAPGGDKFADCSMTWSYQHGSAVPYASGSFNFNLTSNGQSKSYSMLGYAATTLSATTEGQNDVYQMSAIPTNLGQLKVGDRIEMVTVYFTTAANSANDTVADLRLSYFGVYQPVITRISRREKPEANGVPAYQEICLQTMNSRHQNPWLNNFTASPKGLNPSAVSLMVDWIQTGKEGLCLPESYFNKPAPQQ